jgi:Leucine-rich repeat (LRR) protein
LKNWEGDKVIIDNNIGVIKLIRIVDKKEEEIALSNYKKFAGKKLVFENCANLKRIEVDCLNLTGLEIENCPRLEHLSAYNNKIKSLDLKGLSNLKELKISDNQLSNLINLKDCGKLESLDLRNNKLSQLDLDNKSKLTDLDCSHNFISELKVKHLSELKLLHCYYNNLLSLDCSNLKNLKDLNCHNNNNSFSISTFLLKFSSLNIEGCESLERLDAAENGLEKYDYTNFKNLKVISLKENKLDTVTLEAMPNLAFLDISRQFSSN